MGQMAIGEQAVREGQGRTLNWRASHSRSGVEVIVRGMNLGLTEMIFLFVLGLLLFGPKKLPEIGRKLGKALAEFKRASNEFQSQLNDEVRKLEVEEEEKSSISPPDGTTARASGSAYPLDSASGGHWGETPEQVSPSSSEVSDHPVTDQHPERQNG
jgi:sec-independent protein translocase protein TatA